MGWKNLLKGKPDKDAEYREQLKQEILAESKSEIKARLKKEIIDEEVSKLSGHAKKDKVKDYLTTMSDAFAGSKHDDSDEKVNKILGKDKSAAKGKKKSNADADKNYFGDRLDRIL
jgi:hypothetical protein